MTDDPRVQQLLDELIGSHTTPEAVCKSCPELLPVVRKKWLRVRRLSADLDAVFPPGDDAAPSLQETALPQVPGYEVEAVLGRGGMGIVFRAKHLRLNRLVALKMLLAGAYAAPYERARFQREAEAVARLQHPNIVQVHDVGDIDGRPYFTMEYVANGGLAHKLAGVPQPPRQAAQLVATLAAAVQAAHERGIVHRDLKPANVLLAEDGTPKITDFGLARQQGDGAVLTQTGMTIGTPSYMAPEQARGRPDAIGPAVDVYALGAILYELLTGRPPFRAATSAETVQQVISQEPAPPSRLNDQVSRDLETICLKCLSKEPPSRYGTAAELANDLLRYLRGEPILARRANPAERLVKWMRRNRSLAAFLISGILLLNVLVAVVVSVVVDRNVLRRTIGADFREVVESQRRQAWDDAHSALERAKGRLGDGGPPELRQRAGQLSRELALVGELEDILLSSLDPNSPESGPQRTAARYEQVLREAGLVNGPENTQVVAARIRATGIAEPVLAALDCWAWRDEGRRNWLNEVARHVDENPASRPMRDSRLWEDRVALEEFARSAPLANQSVPFLHFLGLKLYHGGGNSVAYYQRVQQAHVDSQLANFVLAFVLRLKGNDAESLRYFQAAVALRPAHAGMRHTFGQVLGRLGRWDQALVEFEEASRLVPELPVYSTDVGVALNNLQEPARAERHFRRVLEDHPTYAPCLAGLARSLFDQGQHAKAIDTVRQAVAMDPTYESAYRQLKDSLLTLHRWEEGRDAWKQWQALNPSEHQAWDGYAELCLYLGNEAEYRRARTELLKRFANTTDPQVAERTGRSCLLLPASEEELRQATSLIDLALASDRAQPGWLLPYFRFAKALAEYRAARLEGALILLDRETLRVLGPAPRLLLAMVQHGLGQAGAARDSLSAATASYVWDPQTATGSEAWMYHLLRREAETVLASTP